MRQVFCWRGGLTRWLSALLVGAILNVSGLYLNSASANVRSAGTHTNVSGNSEPTEGKTGAPFYYGIDPDRVPFALRADGTKARYVSLCASHIKLQISKTTSIGEVEFRRLSLKETLVTYAPAGGETLSIRSTASPQAGKGKETVLTLALELKGQKVDLNLVPGETEGQVLPRNTAAKWQAMRRDAKTDDALLRLLTEANSFLNGPAFSGLLPFLRQEDALSPFGCQFDCVFAINQCILAASAYLGGIGSLILLCGETLGFTCVLAIAAHPFLAAAVGMSCSSAVKICQNCRNGHATLDDGFEMLMQ